MSTLSRTLQTQTILIIGGTSGLGLAVASTLLASNAHVIISGSRPDKLETVLSSLRSAHPSTSGSITGFTADLASKDVEANLQNLRSQVEAYLSKELKTDVLNHLIYTAGDPLNMMPVEDVTLEKFNSSLQVRGAAALLAVKTFLSLIPRKNESSITLTSGSIAGKPIAGGWSVVSFGGGGVVSMSRQLAFDLRPLRVNCVAPGVVDTGLWSGMSEEQKKGMFEAMEKQLPTGRVPGPEDVAESYLYLLRDRNCTGETIYTNGGSFLV